MLELPLPQQPTNFSSDVTTASDRGWRACLNGHKAFGLWDRETARQSITRRELLAVLLALPRFRPLLQSSCDAVQVMTENIATATNIKHLDEPNPGVTDLTWSLCAYAHSLSVTLAASHLSEVETDRPIYCLV